MDKTVIAGVLIALVAGAAIGYLVLPMIFPLQAAADQSGKIVQTKFVSADDNEAINQIFTSPEAIENMTKSITTGGSSYLVIRFNTMYQLWIMSSGTGTSMFEINILVNGQFYRNGTIGGDTISGVDFMLMGSFTMEYVTGTLAAGSYTVNMTWNFVGSGTADSTLFFSRIPGMQCNRSLLVQEIHI